MSPENFAYWLNGYLEISGTKELSSDQLKIVQDHLALVLTKVTPIVSPQYVPYVSGTDQVQQHWPITFTC
jgi:hypothetical protein